MNIFDNIQPAFLRLHPYITMDQYEETHRDLEVPVIRLTGTEPSSKMIDNYNLGYTIRFTLTTCMNLTELVEKNVLIAVFDDQDNLQIGDDRGFRITTMTYTPTIDMNYYVYQFQTDKPNKVPFQKIK